MNIAGPEGFTIGGRFAVRRRLGAGGFGIVYEALDLEQRSTVALKTLRKVDSERLLRLKHEFRALADISHPNLITLYELFSADGQWFFTMELIDGMDFLAYVRDFDAQRAAETRTLSSPAMEDAQDGNVAPAFRRYRALPNMERLRSALGQLVRGVDALHHAGQLHLDLKPSNVLLTREGRAVVLDFGMISEKSAASARGRIAGTPRYMAPEQGLRVPLAESADWYAVGTMLFEALTGMPPFDGPGKDILLQKLHVDAPLPSTIAPGVPDDLDGLCAKLLRRDPGTRPDAALILQTLGLDRDARLFVSRDAPFVGRSDQLRALADAFESVKHGRCVQVVVHGRSGMGKTAFVQHFLSGLRERERCLVLAGRCYEQEFAPYQALDTVVDELSKHLASLTLEELRAVLPEDAFLLCRLFPVLQSLITEVTSAMPEPPDAREARRRAFAGMRNLFGNLARRTPTVVFIDDLHWSDADSRPLIAEILRGPDPPPLLWISTRRSVEPTHTGELLISVDELTEEESRELAGTLVSGDPERAIAAARESGGNPLFLYELARFSLGAQQPADLDQAFAGRVAALPPPARRMLEVAAVARRPLRRDIARDAAEVGPEESGVLAQLRGARLLRTRGAESHREVEIYHDRIRRAVLAHIPAEHLLTHHASLAGLLERSGPCEPEILMFHFQGAGDRPKTAQYAVAAGEQSDHTLAFQSAAGYYRVALETGALAAPRAAEVHVCLADSLTNAGLGSEAAVVYRSAAGQQTDESIKTDLLRRAGWQYLLSGYPGPGIELIRDVLARVGLQPSSTRGGALLRLVWRRARIAIRGYEFREREAAGLARDELLRIDTCWSAAQGLSMTDTFQAASFQGLHLLLALQAGEPYRVGRALCVEAGYFALSGAPGGTKPKALLARASLLSARLHHPHLEGLVSLVTGMSAFLGGRWKEASEVLEAAEDVLRRKCVGVAWELATARLMGCVALFFLGDLRRLSERLPALLENADTRGDVYEATDLRIRISHAHLLALDRAADAIDELDRAIAKWPGDRFYLQHWWSMIARVDIALYANEPVRAWETVAKSWPGLRRSFFLRIQYIRVESLYHRACAALALGDRRSLRIASRDGARLRREAASWVGALADAVHAGVAAVRGRFEEASVLLEHAEIGFAGAGMAMYAAAARRCRGELAGDAAGRELIDAADRLIVAQGVVDPASMAAMLIPVFVKRARAASPVIEPES
jgi:hypothetical protein